jgi:class 3 adenylate cyclase
VDGRHRRGGRDRGVPDRDQARANGQSALGHGPLYDIVESTETARSLGDDAWRDRLDRHDLLAERQISRFGGQVVKQTGDGVLATFEGPAAAIRCAGTMSDGVAQIGVSIRCGVHVGEIEQRGDDIAGIAVHIAARVCSAARAGETLVSRTVTDLVAGSGIEFEDRGECELKGVPGSWHLFAVMAGTAS